MSLLLVRRRIFRVRQNANKVAAAKTHAAPYWTQNCQQRSMFSRWRNLNVTRIIISPSCSQIAADFFSLRPRQSLSLCTNPSRKSSGKSYNVPPSAEFVARVSGIPTMAKLPYQETAEGLDAAFIGVPIDTGTSNRPGARWC